MSQELHAPGATIQLECSLVNREPLTAAAVTGETLVVSLRRLSDDRWWDFVAGEWDVVADYASLTADHQGALTDKGDGSYSRAWDQQVADGGVEREYRAYYRVTSAGDWQHKTAEARLGFVAWAPAATDVAGAVLDAAVASHQTAGSLGWFVNLIARLNGWGYRVFHKTNKTMTTYDGAADTDPVLLTETGVEDATEITWTPTP